jgi:tetratricopeptide (TPR) repeat protein
MRSRITSAFSEVLARLLPLVFLLVLTTDMALGQVSRESAIQRSDPSPPRFRIIKGDRRPAPKLRADLANQGSAAGSIEVELLKNGEIYAALGNYARAALFMQEALRINPRLKTARINLSWIWFNHAQQLIGERDYSQAAVLLEKSLATIDSLPAGASPIARETVVRRLAFARGR